MPAQVKLYADVEKALRMLGKICGLDPPVKKYLFKGVSNS
jgi:hypothetical protein